ncbi:MAG: DNA protecting protein DprA [Candidatus Epulonipiscioides saccharophilum]|nr:MAG: DNA protecting protein DprA [Epulopiscium sp. AS2M-Bin001]
MYSKNKIKKNIYFKKEDEELYSIWFHMTRLNSIKKKEFIENAHSFTNLYNFQQDFLKFDSKKLSFFSNFNSESILNKAQEIFEDCKSKNIDIINYFSTEYPPLLRHIADPPMVLFGKGQKETLGKLFIAIVGARDCSVYGHDLAYQFSHELAQKGICLISGLATGIDTIVHQSALNFETSTIAVLGTGVNNCYSKYKKLLLDKIIENGYIISEYWSHRAGNKYTYPKRNRIITGLSHGVLVIEAEVNSGSTNSAAHARDQNRTTFVIPSNLKSIASTGTNELLKNTSALLIQNVNDILEDIVDIPKFTKLNGNTFLNFKMGNQSIKQKNPHFQLKNKSLKCNLISILKYKTNINYEYNDDPCDDPRTVTDYHYENDYKDGSYSLIDHEDDQCKFVDYDYEDDSCSLINYEDDLFSFTDCDNEQSSLTNSDGKTISFISNKSDSFSHNKKEITNLESIAPETTFESDKKISLDKNESLVYDCLSCDSLSYAELIKKTGITDNQLNIILFKLLYEKCVISKLPGHRYSKKR